VDYTHRIPPEVARLEGARCFTLGRDDKPEISAYAYNEGIRQARGDIIVLPDADVACTPDLLETIKKELTEDPELVLYALRLNQREDDFKPEPDIDYLRKTCTLNHTFNFGGCTAVRREWLLKMNGYEQLPFFAGYHYNGGDNYLRFKNMGLKIRWHPTQRVYHPWHMLPPQTQFSTAQQQEEFLRYRAASWDWQAFDGLNPALNRDYDSRAARVSDWPCVTTERGLYVNPSCGEETAAPSRLSRARQVFHDCGVLKGSLQIAGHVLVRMGSRP
jgi:glycosyltransferase involved in cell wall biosynthesis